MEQLPQPQQDLFEVARQSIEETKEKKAQEVVIKKKRRVKKWVFSIIAAVVIAGGATGGYLYYQDQQAKAVAQYELKLVTTSMTILSVASNAEEICNGYTDVWSKAIDNRRVVVNGQTAYDFNDALRYKRDELKGMINEMNKKADSLQSDMKALNNPNPEYQKAYDVLFQIYSLVNEYKEQANSPTGSLVTFGQKRNQLSNDILKKFNEFKILMPNAKL